MFAEFFYLLRARGLDVSLSEWLTLLEALERGLHHSSLTGFYQLCRMVLVKDEADYDRFDRVFLEFFRGVPDETLEQLMARLQERLKEQTEEHNGGNYWVGTQGRSPLRQQRRTPRRHPHRRREPTPHGGIRGGGAPVPGLPGRRHAG